MNLNSLTIYQGDQLTQHELKDRLRQMNETLDENVAQKSSLVDQYNTQLKEEEKKMMIIDRLHKDNKDKMKKESMKKERRRTMFSNTIKNNELNLKQSAVERQTNVINQKSISSFGFNTRYSIFKIPNKAIKPSDNKEDEISNSNNNTSNQSNAEGKFIKIEIKTGSLFNNSKRSSIDKSNVDKLKVSLDSVLNQKVLNETKLSKQNQCNELNERESTQSQSQNELIIKQEQDQSGMTMLNIASLNIQSINNNDQSIETQTLYQPILNNRNNIILEEEDDDFNINNSINSNNLFYNNNTIIKDNQKDPQWNQSSIDLNNNHYIQNEMLMKQIENQRKHTSIIDSIKVNHSNSSNQIMNMRDYSSVIKDQSFKLLYYGLGIGSMVIGGYYCVKLNKSLISYIKNESNVQQSQSNNESLSSLLDVILDAFKNGVVNIIQKPIKYILSFLSSYLLSFGQVIFWDNIKLTISFTIFLLGSYYIWKEYTQSQFIQTIFNNIKEDLYHIHQTNDNINSGLTEYEIIKEYSIQNGYSERLFDKIIMPKLRDLRAKDDKVKEFEDIINNKQQRIWQWSEY